MQRLKTKIQDIILLEPRVFGDARGYFFETWRQNSYKELGIPDFVQDNLSRSTYGVLRGLHIQEPHSQGKLVTVLWGEVYDVAVDLRRDSPTFGNWEAVLLSSDNHRQLYVPPGFGHGFCVTSQDAVFAYKCTDYYHPEFEKTVQWNDPDLAIPWPVSNPVISAKDVKGISLLQFKNG
ncbi:MAG: dTDP-4-dehydrorhamnose 3,5-epimerase [Deltaproteobacteria bacterium CG11_big_fil_rev_8_21_14_0_20_47_16]|nr:MAG: dTDP-4-dehydrorhamnose 3,5-epimerase [Deltaproteobacteria bacterium CG11_big_fil_rev_8_21_14_0_20_47_16]